ncbi:5-epi-aristolochene synthase [Trichinella pseudospiralis]
MGNARAAGLYLIFNGNACTPLPVSTNSNYRLHQHNTISPIQYLHKNENYHVQSMINAHVCAILQDFSASVLRLSCF